MENIELSHLQKEIALRGRIIETLVSANEEIRFKCSHLVSFVQSKTDSFSPAEKEWLQNMFGDWLRENGNGTTGDCYAFSEKGKASETLSYSSFEKEKGIDTGSYSNVKKGNASDTRIFSFAEKENGTGESGYSISEKGKGTTGFGYSVSGKVNAPDTFVAPISEKGNGITKPLKPLPEKIEPGKISVFTLKEKMNGQTRYKGRSSAVYATADLLVHIYNGGDCGYPTLKKVTKLSTSGLGKMLMRLTKKGLIKRTGLQKLALTQSALSLLQHTWHETGRE